MSQVKSSQVKSSQVKSSQVKSSQVKSSQVKSSLIIFNLLSIFFMSSIEAATINNPVYFQPASLIFTGPADSVSDLTIIPNTTVDQPSEAGKNYQYCPRKGSDGGTYDELVVRSLYAESGYHIVGSDGLSYPIFKTTVPGIGFILKARDLTDAYHVVKATDTRIYYNENYTGLSLGMNMQFSWVKYPDSFSPYVGTLDLGSVLQVGCYKKHNLVSTTDAIAQPFDVNIAVYTCNISDTSIQTIEMGEVDFLKLFKLSVNQTLDDSAKNISFDLSCQSTVTPYATITDGYNKSNTTSIFTLQNPSEATTTKGVGYQVFVNGGSTAQLLGPESATVNNVNQFKVANKFTQDGTATLDLMFKYVKTSDTVAGGVANAMAIITFSYQ